MTTDTIWEGRIPPQNIEAERTVLGCMLQDDDAREAGLNLLSADRFYFPGNAMIFEAIGETKGDLIVVTNYLKDHGQLNASGGAGYITSLVNTVPTVGQVERCGKIILDKAARRRTLKQIMIAAECAYNKPLDDLIDSVSAIDPNLYRVLGDGDMDGGHIAEAIAKRRERIAAKESVFVPTGFGRLDELMSGGMPCGFPVVIKSLPGTGKSAFTLQILDQMVENGYKVLYISLEMRKEDIWPRVIGSRLKRRGLIDGSFDYTWLYNTHEWIKDKPDIQAIEADEKGWFIDDRETLNDAEIIRATRYYVKKHGVQVVAIDYVNLVGLHDNTPNGRVQFIERLRVLCKGLNIVMIWVFQFDFVTEREQKNITRLGNVRGYKSAEQAGAVSIALCQKGSTDIVQVVIPKCRMGQCGYHEMLFHGKCQTFIPR